jgi:hypothetical protein
LLSELLVSSVLAGMSGGGRLVVLPLDEVSPSSQFGSAFGSAFGSPFAAPFAPPCPPPSSSPFPFLRSKSPSPPSSSPSSSCCSCSCSASSPAVSSIPCCPVTELGVGPLDLLTLSHPLGELVSPGAAALGVLCPASTRFAGVENPRSRRAELVRLAEVKDVVLLLFVTAWRKVDSVLATTMLEGWDVFLSAESPVMGATAPCWSCRSRSVLGVGRVPPGLWFADERYSSPVSSVSDIESFSSLERSVVAMAVLPLVVWPLPEPLLRTRFLEFTSIC